MLDLNELAPPAAWLACAEKRELLRQAAAGMLNNPRLDPASVPFAEHWSAQPPLTAPLSAGQPKEAHHVENATA